MGYFDIQVNGYGGVDFNQDHLTGEDLLKACRLLRAHGVDGILATVITDDADRMVHRIRSLVELRRQNAFIREVIQGVHVEGPFISPVNGFRGAHPAFAVRPAERGLAERLLEAGDGLIRLVTLAPEQDSQGEVTRFLSGQGILVSAGHTDASVRQLEVCIEAGLGMFTHLGNGCPLAMHRHDNIVQRALSLRKHLWLALIADGIHVPYFALRNYIDLARTGRGCMVTTDAMSAAGLGPGLHRLAAWTVNVGEDLAAWNPERTHLVGSAMPMYLVVKQLCQCGFSAAEIELMTDVAPRGCVFGVTK